MDSELDLSEFCIHFKNQGKMHIRIVKIKCLSRLSISKKSHLPLDLKRIHEFIAESNC